MLIRPTPTAAILLLATTAWSAMLGQAVAQDSSRFTAVAFGDAGFATTEFFAPTHDAVVGNVDARIEFWPTRGSLSWGPFIRIARTASTSSEVWENAWFAGPGIGVQVYPFSLTALRTRHPALAALLGPTRLFAELNRTAYGTGAANDWRPNSQVRGGIEYWSAQAVNDPTRPAWLETWLGALVQSSNEFMPNYDTLKLGGLLRGGVRMPGQGGLTWLSPYGMAATSRSNRDRFYWDNYVRIGWGVRVAPPIGRSRRGLTRLVVYVEDITRVGSYGRPVPADVPKRDLHAGVSFAIGDWFGRR